MFVNLLHLMVLLAVLSGISQSQRPCNLYCDEQEQHFPSGIAAKGAVGSPGKQGPIGQRGQRGNKGETGSCQCPELGVIQSRVEALGNLQDPEHNLPRNCQQIFRDNNLTSNGVYNIQSSNGIEYPAYCDMSLGGGGWTLVASIHENNIRNTGRCTVGDRWSSEHGHEPGSRVGADAWVNFNTFGHVASATSDDYKNQGYFDLQARDVMIWQVPNNTPLESYSSSSYLQYRTSDGFLSGYGGNLLHLYRDHFPIKSGTYARVTDNGPAIPVTYDKGNANEVIRQFGPNTHAHIDAGYIQFRVINNERSAYALCPGTRAKSSHGNCEHTCIGSTADNQESVRHCGDFAGFVLDAYGTGAGWNADRTIVESTFLIFYR